MASILVEFIVSTIYYVIRDWYLSEFNPTTLFLALFIRSQLTNTITMVLIFLPKLYFQHRQVSKIMNWGMMKNYNKTKIFIHVVVISQVSIMPIYLTLIEALRRITTFSILPPFLQNFSCCCWLSQHHRFILI